MARRLYFAVGRQEVPALEGLVEYVRVDSRPPDEGYRRETARVMYLKLEGIPKELTLPGVNVRVDRGERVRIYSKRNFTADGGCVDAEGLQVLDEQGAVKFELRNDWDVLYLDDPLPD